MKNNIRQILLLTRFPLSLAIGFSAVTGQLICSHTFNLCTLYTFVGVVLLSGAASAINQYQERTVDAKMGRTHHRPLPSGQMKPSMALVIAVLIGLIVVTYKRRRSANQEQRQEKQSEPEKAPEERKIGWRERYRMT